METTYRLHIQEIDPAFLQSLKTLFAGKEVEITVKSIQEAGSGKDKLGQDSRSVETAENISSHLERPTFKALKLKTKNFKFDRDEANAR